MSTRSGKRTGKSKGSDRSVGWSDWTWDQGSLQYYRTRLNSKGEYDYQYDQRQVVAEEYTPRGAATTSDNIASLPSTASPHSPQYYGNPNYGYQDSSQNSDAVVGELSGQFAQASLADERTEPSASTSYVGHHLNDEQPTEFDSSATAPIPIPPNPSRSRHDPDTRDYSYSSDATVVARQSWIPGGSSSLMPSGYDAPTSSIQYPPQHLPYGPSYDSTDNYPGPSMVDAYGRPTPIVDYSDFSRGYAESQSGTQQNYNASAATNSGAITPKASYKTITGTPGTKEALDPNFRVHHSKYFKFGQVFKVLWFEPQGQNTADTSVTEVTDFSWNVGDTKYGQRAHSSIRRFVIVAADDGHCQCLPILTYHRQATKKWGVKKEDHAIIYTGDSPPREIEGEPPLKLRPIRVIPKTPRDKLEKESRINYAKIYTVEHNVKVHFIGQVHPSAQHRLVTDFDAAWMKKRQINPAAPDYSSSSTVDSSKYMGGGYR